MAKSKLAQVNERIAGQVTDTFQKIEDTVVGGYKAVEKAAVGAYTGVEDSFVEHFLTQDGETVEEAKARLKKEEKP